MQFGGSYLVAAPRPQVWQALNDTQVLRATIPGCRSIDWTGATTLELEIQVNLGLMQPVFAGELELRDVVAAERYTLVGRGRGGLLGKAEAAADIVLSDAGHQTRLVFTANGGADGGIMKLGKSLIGNSAQKVIDGFFERFGEAMGVEVSPIT
ncbi:MAG: carbon monoxide dehydrogenase [Devosia sp.]|uniref:CoxG family protein n=1 Tax=Devosia sp. TaxID=1871048 RepID=UPI001AD38077|nr:SRPBCC domain-containing protein [Devosia sp.]MBN9311119.1 carbon monoxide dehydrogenase [Devosia sp.]MBN9314870.1 carbon monoxide dehydrogenase [Devosia sp.]